MRISYHDRYVKPAKKDDRNSKEKPRRNQHYDLGVEVGAMVSMM
jgi:hypothetical protein